MNYENFPPEELEKLKEAYIRRHWSNGGRSEFDMSINDISRAMIKKYREKHGSCLLGVLNKKHGEGSMFVPYTGQKVFNFEFDFAVPYPDGQLSDMLTEYCAPKKEYSSQNVYRSIQAILSRIEEIGGLYLMWA